MNPLIINIIFFFMYGSWRSRINIYASRIKNVTNSWNCYVTAYANCRKTIQPTRRTIGPAPRYESQHFHSLFYSPLHSGSLCCKQYLKSFESCSALPITVVSNSNVVVCLVLLISTFYSQFFFLSKFISLCFLNISRDLSRMGGRYSRAPFYSQIKLGMGIGPFLLVSID